MADEEKSPERRYRRLLRRPRIIVIAAVLLGIVLMLIYSSRANAPEGKPNGSSQKTPNLFLSPASQKIPLSSALSVKVWADSKGQKVNTVEADLTYPIDKLNFVNVDTIGSAFGLSVQASGNNGTINIERGSFSPVSGKLLVATINFTGANSSGEATIKFTNKTALVSASTHKDILGSTYDGHYTLTQ